MFGNPLRDKIFVLTYACEARRRGELSPEAVRAVRELCLLIRAVPVERQVEQEIPPVGAAQRNVQAP